VSSIILGEVISETPKILDKNILPAIYVLSFSSSVPLNETKTKAETKPKPCCSGHMRKILGFGTRCFVAVQ